MVGYAQLLESLTGTFLLFSKAPHLFLFAVGIPNLWTLENLTQRSWKTSAYGDSEPGFITHLSLKGLLNSSALMSFNSNKQAVFTFAFSQENSLCLKGKLTLSPIFCRPLVSFCFNCVILKLETIRHLRVVPHKQASELCFLIKFSKTPRSFSHTHPGKKCPWTSRAICTIYECC